MKAIIKYNLNNPEEYKLLTYAIRSEELALACISLNNNLYKMFDYFSDQNNLDEELAQKLDDLKVRIYNMIPHIND